MLDLVMDIDTSLTPLTFARLARLSMEQSWWELAVATCPSNTFQPGLGREDVKES